MIRLELSSHPVVVLATGERQMLAPRDAALLAFDRSERACEDEVGARPSPDTLALLATIERAKVAAPAPAPACSTASASRCRPRRT